MATRRASPSHQKQHVEVVSAIVRGGEGYTRPGDPFEWVLYIARGGDRDGYALAMIGRPSLHELRRAREELAELGFEHLTFTRTSGRNGRIALRRRRDGK